VALRWRKEHRQKLHGIRTLHKLDPPRAPTDPASSWRWLRERYLYCAGQPWSFLSASGACAPYLDAVRESYQRDEPPAALDPDIELTRAAICTGMDWGAGFPNNTFQPQAWRALVSLWLGRAGLRFAWSLYQRVAPFGVIASVAPPMFDGSDPGALRLLLTEEQPGPRWSPRGYAVEACGPRLPRALREIIFDLGDEAFAALRQEATSLWEGPLERGGAPAAPYFAFAFAREPRFADACAKLLGERSPAHDWNAFISFGGECAVILASLQEPARALELLARVQDLATRQHKHIGQSLCAQLTDYRYDLVEAMGAESAAVLSALLLFDCSGSLKREFSSALKLARSGA
jgi:hypothetical protein